MEPAGLLRELKEGRVRPKYLFVGGEDLLKVDALDALRQAAGGGRVRRVSPGDLSAQELLDERSNLTLLDPVAAFVVRPAAKLAAGDAEALLGDVGEGPPIVFWDATLDRRTKLFAEVTKSGAAVDFKPLTAGKAVAWLGREARSVGVKLGPNVAETLVDLLGTGLQRLRRNVELLALAVGDDGLVTEAIVADMVPEARAHALYELQDALASRDVARAMKLYRSAIDHGETPYALVGVVLAELRRLRLAREAGLGEDRGDLARRIGAPPFRIDRLLRQARRFPKGVLERALGSLAALDVDLKTGRGDATAALEAWILDLTADDGP